MLKPLKRLDNDGQPFLSTPYKLRHGSESVQVALDEMPMIGQLVTFVPAAVYQESYQRCGPRGVEAIFVGFVKENGIIKNVAKLIPLEAVLTGSGSVRPIYTKDWRQPHSERQFPSARLRDWKLHLRGAKL